MRFQVPSVPFFKKFYLIGCHVIADAASPKRSYFM